MAAAKSISERQALLAQASEAASRRDLTGMLEALFASGFIDGLTRRLQRQWDGRLGQVDVDQCIAQAVDAAYDAVAQGKSPRDLGPWLWKAAQNTASDRWKSEARHCDSGFDEFDTIEAVRAKADTERHAADELVEHRRREQHT